MLDLLYWLIFYYVSVFVEFAMGKLPGYINNVVLLWCCNTYTDGATIAGQPIPCPQSNGTVAGTTLMWAAVLCENVFWFFFFGLLDLTSSPAPITREFELSAKTPLGGLEVNYTAYVLLRNYTLWLQFVYIAGWHRGVAVGTVAS